VGKDVSITFGERMDVEVVFGPFRERWREMARRSEERKSVSHGEELAWESQLGEVHDQELRYGAEAEQLRKEVTIAVRNEVLKVRRATGLPDEDPKCSLVETWREEGSVDKVEGKMKDGSVVEDM
jgi:monolysocardiolipin acyltransferase